MKILPLLLLPLFCSSCALIQMPARLIKTALGPLTDAQSSGAESTVVSVALKVDSTAPGPTISK